MNNYCPNCGTKLKNNPSRCPKCKNIIIGVENAGVIQNTENEEKQDDKGNKYAAIIILLYVPVILSLSVYQFVPFISVFILPFCFLADILSIYARVKTKNKFINFLFIISIIFTIILIIS